MRGSLLALIILTTLSSTGYGDVKTNLPISDRVSCCIKLENGLLSINVESVPLQDVLKQISQIGKFKLFIYGELEQKISINHSEQPLTMALHHLLKNESSLIKLSHNHEKNQLKEPHVQTVFVISTNRSNRSIHEMKKIEIQGTGVDKSSKEIVLSRTNQARLDTIHDVAFLDAEQAIPLLSEFLSGEEEPLLRSEALTVLSGFEGDAAFDAIATALADPAIELRLQAIEALTYADNERTIQYLGQVIFGDPDAAVRQLAVQLLRSYQNESEAARSILAAVKTKQNKAQGK